MKNNRSTTEKYWISLILIFWILIIAKLLNIPILEKVPIHIAYFIYFILIIPVSLYKSFQLKNLIQDKYPEKYEKMLNKYWFVNRWKFSSFTYSSEDFNDKEIKYLKNENKKFTIFMITLFACTPIFFLIEILINNFLPN